MANANLFGQESFQNRSPVLFSYHRATEQIIRNEENEVETIRG